MINAPIKTCDYCGTQGTMPTYMDGETCCSECSRNLPRDIPSARKLVLSLRNQLIESHAREAQLRECITNMAGNPRAPRFESAFDTAMNLPTDDSTLKARLKAERERCATEAGTWGFGSDAATAIRNLGDE